MESILQQFLSSQIINIEEDGNHDKLIKASKDLIKLSEKDKHKFQKIALSAFDPEISVDDANVVETKNLIIKHWSTFINKCQNMPLTYVRAVMLEALWVLSERQEYAAIIWLSASGASSFYQVESREKPILVGLLTECADKYEAVGLNIWNSGSTLTDIKIELESITDSKKVGGIKTEYLPEKLTAAAVNGNPISNNRSYGDNTIHQAWANDFGKLAGEAINAALSLIVKQTNEVLEAKANSEGLQKSITSFNAQVSLVINDLIRKSQSADLRGRLLWFKEALYSNSQKNSFRKLPKEISTIAMSFEYSKMLPEYCPVSTEFFLTEILLHANVDVEQSISFDALLGLLISNKDLLKIYFTKNNLNKLGRLSLVNYIGDLLNDLVAKSDFYLCTGIPLEKEITWITFTNWMYREFQAQKFIIKK